MEDDMEILAIDLAAIARMTLILVHILAVAAAGAGIAFGDYAIFSQHRIDTRLLYKAGQAVTAALLMLWMTGLVIIWMDTHFEWAVLVTKPKLLAKLTVVTMLSINGVALHCIVFKRLSTAQNDALVAAKLPSVLGAISVVTWLYAAFVGLAKPVAPLLGYVGFMGLYFVVLIIGVVAALILMRPRLAQRITLAEHASGMAVSPHLKTCHRNEDVLLGSNQLLTNA